jgi:hypothetical protein
MKEGHHGRLEIVRRWIQLDGTRLEKLRVEHLKNIESVGLVERSWMPPLIIPIENDCVWTRWRSKLLTRKLLWKYRFSSFKALPAIHLQSSTAAPTRSLSQGVESKLVLQVGDSDLSLS